jgi:hypothetical protein
MPYPALPPEPPALVSVPESEGHSSFACPAIAAPPPPSSPLRPAPVCSPQTTDQLLQPALSPSTNRTVTYSVTPSDLTQLSPATVSQQPSDSETLPIREQTKTDRPIEGTPEPEIAPESAPEILAEPSPEKQPDVLEVTGDRQDYDTLKQVLSAVGNVLLRFRKAELTADRVRTTVQDRQVVAEGQVKLTRGNQVLEGERLEYSLEQNRGVFFKPTGTISFPTSDRDFSLDTTSTNTTGSTPLDPLSDPRQTDQTVESGTGIQTVRFEADRIEFVDGAWTATNIRITSDPFSPPELEIRADEARLTRVSETEDEVKLKRPRLVFDQNVSIPLLRSSIRLGRGRQDPFGFQVGFDDRDRGGLFLGGRFTPFTGEKFNLTLTPQLFLGRLINRSFDVTDPDVYGFTATLGSQLTPTTSFDAFFSLNTINITNAANNIRGRLRLQQQLGDHRLSLESAYRERSLNGSLGEQEILNRNSLILTSPTLRLGKTGLDLDYRVAAEYITAVSDDPSLGDPASLGRFQGSLALGRSFTLWQGKTLPPTATEGLRYTSEPVLPTLRLVTRLTGTATGYTSGDTQTTLIGSARLEGQFGHFSRPYLDYTSFNVGYAQVLQGGSSPFLFDRVVDQQVLSAGILQHIYGPFRLGFQTSLNLDTGNFFNSDFILDYSRRTYGITLRFNPELEAVSLLFRVGGFNFVGNRGPHSSPEVGVVEAGVQETNDPF